MLLHLKHLLLEVTRKCNMACPHCMRGDAENLSMDYAVIDRIFEDTRQIDHLVLTGGEPSLAPYVIQQILYRARVWKCSIHSFFCATNAKTYSQPFVDALCGLYDYCKHPEYCTLTVTIDPYHEPADPDVIGRYRALPFYRPVFEYGSNLPYPILTEGRAQKNGIGQSEIPIKDCIYDVDYNGFSCTFGDTVYVNAKGGVLLNADLSYQSQGEFCIGNLTEDSLPHILSTVLYMPQFSYRERVFRTVFASEAGTVAPMKLEDQRYYFQESAAMGAFHQIIHNLQITPIGPDIEKIPDELRLTVEQKDVKELPDSRLCEAAVTYWAHKKKLGSVHIYVEHFPLEDAKHE